MSQDNNLKRIKVFFCGPQDVGEERDALPKLLDTTNTSFGHDQGFHFESLDWTQVPPGAGPPQPRITPKIREADLVITCFWTRWGVPPTDDSKYTSGTEEEFYEALDEREKNGGARPEIWLFFRDVPPQQLADPGPQLTMVREFQRTVGDERLALYRTYRDLQDWKRKVLAYLRTWLHEGGPGHTIAAEPINPVELRDTAPLLARIGELEQALTEAQKAPAKLQQAALQGTIRAMDAHEEGNMLYAEELYVQSLDLDETVPQIHVSYGFFLQDAARPQEAEEHYRRALELREEYPEAHIGIAMLLAQTARLQEAEEHYGRALELREEYPEAHLGITLLLAQTARLQEAEEHCRRALELREAYPQAHLTMASLLLGQARKEEADVHLDRVRELAPDMVQFLQE